MDDTGPVIVLVVDDQEPSRYLVTRVLNKAGFEVREAATGAEGLRLAAGKPDLIVLDVSLPDINGFEVCQRLKSDPATASIPVLQMSASFTRSSDRTQGLDSGADAYLVQPVEPPELVATIRALLRVRRAEEQARVTSREWQTTFDAIGDCVFLLDRAGRVLRCNRSAGELLGTSCDPGEPRPLDELLRAALGPLEGPLPGSAREKGSRETHEIRAGGRWFRLTEDPVRDESGRVSGSVCTLSDVTERKQAEKERAQLLQRERAARAEAEAANRSKDQFLATLSHELRTPLTSMLSWARLLRTGQLDAATTARGLETIERNVKVQAQLIEDLLDISRIISGKIRLEVGPVDLVAVIEAAVEVLRPAADARRIRLHVLPDPAAAAAWGDPARLQQVVWNLVSNAIKFTPEGGEVRVALARSGTQAEITVRDTGQGIPPELLPYVFERFRQGDASSTRTHGGLGLGLAIVRHLVELHGGTVRAESAGVGKGSTFAVRLPVAAVRLPDSDPGVPARADLDGEVPLPSLAGLRVLIVDDEDDARKVLALVLERAGAAVTSAGSAREALEAFRAGPPDVLLSDVEMPQEDGYALIRQVRALPAEQGGRVPAAALTAYARNEDRKRALLAGFQMHVAKPIEPADLAVVVATLAGRIGKG